MAGREIIQIYIGQAGVQVANACWELYCLEHGINCDGTLFDLNHADIYSPFFAVSAYGQVVPRVIMIDTEPTVIDEIRTGCYRNLFNPNFLLNGKEDASNNFAKGKYGIGKEMLELSLDKTRKIVEDCGNMQGFIISRAYGGGTGGGLGSLILQSLRNEYSKVSIMEFVVFPSPKLSNIIVEPYNTVLSTHESGEYQDIAFICENQAVHNILCSKFSMCTPTFKNVNRIIGQVLSNVTASLRFEGAINVDLKEFLTNLIPYRRIHYPVISYSPFIPSTIAFPEQLSVATLTNACFEKSSQLVSCKPKYDKSKFMSCCLLFRGNVTPVDVNNAIINIKHKNLVQFVDWTPVGFKVGINYMPPVAIPGGDLARITRAVTVLSNTSSIKYAWISLLEKYCVMLKKRAFVHHYISEGMDEGDFVDAKEDLQALIMDYNEL